MDNFMNVAAMIVALQCHTAHSVMYVLKSLHLSLCHSWIYPEQQYKKGEGAGSMQGLK